MARSIGTLFLALALASCGGGSTTETTETTETTGGGETATVAWDDMTMEQRGEFMATVVMPAMQPLFQNHDAEEYADFSCATCHGENAHDVGFHMPNGVHPMTHDEVGPMFASSEPDHVWMTQQVWPRMGELLGEALYNPETGEGFSCFNCHSDSAAAPAPAASLPATSSERVAAN